MTCHHGEVKPLNSHEIPSGGHGAAIVTLAATNESAGKSLTAVEIGP
jgi:hypothetical protein